MRYPIAFIVALAVAALVAFAKIHFKHTNAKDAQVAALKSELQLKNQEIEQANEAKKHAEEQKQQLLRLTDDMSAELTARHRQPVPSNGAPAAVGSDTAPASQADSAKAEPGKGFAKMLSQMMEDPETRSFIRQRQRAVMDQLYAPLIKQLGLSSEEAANFKESLAENMIKGTERASALLGSGSPEDRKKALEQIKAEQTAADEQLKGILGEARYNQYKEYQETAGDRALLNQFKQQFPSENQLNEQQTEQVLGILREEKKHVAALTGQHFSGLDQEDANLEAVMSEEGAGKLFEAQETLNSRVYDRASQVLPPAQLENFARFQTNQLQMLRMSMTMARKMFGGQSSGTSGSSASSNK